MFNSPPERTFRQTLFIRKVLMGVSIPLVSLIFLSLIHYNAPQLFPIAYGLTVLVALAVGALCWWMTPRSQLTIHPEGISLSGPRTTIDIRWEDISGTVYHTEPLNLTDILTSTAPDETDIFPVRNANGTLIVHASAENRKINIGSYLEGFKNATQVVLDRVNPRLRADIQRRLNSGEAVPFGAVMLSRQGIAVKNKPEVPFSIAEIEFDGRRLAVKEKGKWRLAFSVGAPGIENVALLLEMTNELRSGANPPRPISRP
jgi:hypothetical protein